ncbi:hypothetical protein FRC01_007717 [Tulasnella sp. 417]|nr:hypothetical protein FRC01_007717 [Tulasnella sp. 417]
MCLSIRVGADVAETGNGPGSYEVRDNIWCLNCSNPEDNGNGGWAFFAAIFGWSNDGSVGTVLGYIFYWIAVVMALVMMQVTELLELEDSLNEMFLCFVFIENF